MASWDNVSLPSAPSAADYRSPLVDFSAIAKLGDRYREGQRSQFDELQRQRELELQKPIDTNDPNAIAAELLKRGGAQYAPQLMEFLKGQQPGAVSPLLGGGSAPSGGMPAPSAPQRVATTGQPIGAGGGVAAPSAPPARGAVYQGGDSGSNTVMSIASDFYGDDKAGNVALNASKWLGVDPNAPLTPEQAQKLTTAFSNSSGRQPTQAAQSAPAQPSAAASPVASPAAASAGAGDQSVILPKGFNDPRQAVLALRQEAARFLASPNARDQSQAGVLNTWADNIEKSVTGPRQFGVVGHDENGQPSYGFINPYSQTVQAPGGGPVGGAAPSAVSGLTGEAYLSTLDPGRAAQIKGIADGRMAPPTGMALKSPQIQALMRQVAQYEPGFDLVNWQARAATRKDFTAGKSSQNLTAFNTAVSHLDTLDKAADGLANTWSPTWNKVGNLINNQLGDPRVTKFNIAKTAVADELTRAFRGSGGNVHDIKQWEEAINSSASPEQLKSAVKQAVELLRGRIESVGDTYNRGMGTTKDPLTLLSPKAQASLARITGEAPAGGAEPTAPAAASPAAGGGAGIPKISTKAEYDALAPGASFIGSDGKPWQKPK